MLKTNTYEYTDTNWKDKLTAYNGQGISYDTIGNPTSYLGYNMNWDNGRELSSLSGNGVTASYSYDANGLRATKTVNGIKTTYQYLDGQLLYEKKGSTELNYFYDADGSLKGIQTVDENGTVTHYYVVTNSRGDVIQIYSTIGELSVIYTYDSWGKILSIKDGNGNMITDDNNIGKLNSLRYRSYYYDEEVGLYYLQSRYYNPEIGRFLNADIITGIPGYLITGNMFTYCLNNPINRVDETGLFSFFKNIYLGVGSYFEFQINGSLWNKDSLASISGYLKANITYGYLVVLGISIGSGKYLSSIVSQWFIKNTFLKEIIADAIGITIISNLVYKKLISFLVGRVTSILKTADKYIKKIPYATTTLWKGKIPFDFSI